MPFNVNGNILSNTQIKLYNNKNIVRSGLILYLDAGISNSYPGSGTTWTDLSDFNNTPTTVNSPTFSTQNGGGWSVDSVGTNYFSLDDKASMINLSQGTIGGWVRFNNLAGANYVFISYGGNGAGGGFLLQSEISLGLELLTFGGSITGGRASLSPGSSAAYVGTNVYMVGTYDSSVVKLYLNGIEVASSAKNSANLPPQSYLRISSEFNRTRGIGGNVYTTHIYNRALSAAEILQNFNAGRQRFIITSPTPAMIVGGTFTTFNGQTHNRIIRLSPNGSVDTSFVTGTGFDNTVVAWGRSVQPDGKVIVGHNFTTYNGTSSPRLARLNTNGSYDSSFNVGTGFDNTTPSISLQSDGKVVVGGAFTTYQGTSAPRIVRLNTDGSIDTGFVYGSGFNGTTENLAIDSSNRIIAVGGFTSYNGTSAIRIARLNANGTIDGTFNTGAGFASNPTRVIIDSSSRILAVGFFGLYNNIATTRIVRINSDGSFDSSLSTGSGFNNTTRAIAQQSDGKLIVGGAFTSYNGTSVNRIIRLNSDGSIDFSFNPGIGFSAGTVWDIAVQPDGKIIAVGDFTSYNGTTANRIIRLNSDGSVDSSFNPGTGFGNNVAFWVQFVTL